MYLPKAENSSDGTGGTMLQLGYYVFSIEHDQFQGPNEPVSTTMQDG
jgi:hypothetical protein